MWPSVMQNEVTLNIDQGLKITPEKNKSVCSD